MTMDWKNWPPDEAGWYWARDKAAGAIEIVKVSEEPEDGGFYVQGFDDDRQIYISDSRFSHWLGPIPKPEPPKE